MARLERLPLDEGRSAVSSSSSITSVSRSPSRNAVHACQTAGPSIRPNVSSRQTSTHARSSPASNGGAARPAAVSSPSEYANAPIGNNESHKWSKGSRFKSSKVLKFSVQC